MDDLVDEIVGRIQTNKDKITKCQIKALKKFDEMNRLKGLRESTRSLQIKMMMQFARTVDKEFHDVTSNNIQNFLSNLDVANSTLNSWKIILKKWYKKNPEIMEAECLEATQNVDNAKKPSDMLLEEDIIQMIKAIVDTQCKAIIGILWETGARVGELVNCDISDLEHIGDIPRLTLDGKTGIRVRELVISAKLINRWLEEHPFNGQQDKPLFLSKSNARFNKRITTHGIADIISRIKEDAKINKKITPHTFRHSRATFLSQFMSEMEMREFFGWSRNSNMPSVYIHLSQKQLNQKYRNIVTGEKKKLEPKPSILMPVSCPRCSKTNDVSEQYCSNCMLPLSNKSVQKDLKIIETFRSPYMKVMGINVDAVVDEFYNFRNITMEMTAFIREFNGGKSMDAGFLRNKLDWTKERFNRLMEYLLETDIVKLNGNNMVEIQTYQGQDGNEKSVFDNFLHFQKLYLSKR